MYVGKKYYRKAGDIMSIIDIQFDEFKELLGRDLSEDEKYLIRNAFNNGRQLGQLDIKAKIAGVIGSIE